MPQITPIDQNNIHPRSDTDAHYRRAGWHRSRRVRLGIPDQMTRI
jgi:hypothetical protein